MRLVQSGLRFLKVTATTPKQTVVCQTTPIMPPPILVNVGCVVSTSLLAIFVMIVRTKRNTIVRNSKEKTVRSDDAIFEMVVRILMVSVDEKDDEAQAQTETLQAASLRVDRVGMVVFDITEGYFLSSTTEAPKTPSCHDDLTPLTGCLVVGLPANEVHCFLTSLKKAYEKKSNVTQ